MMNQLEAIRVLAHAARRDNALVVSEIGSQTVWLHETGDDESYLYLSGPMGMAPSVALGVALCAPERPVLALCGDGALAMNFSALVTVAAQAPANLTLAVMDNGVYEFTGRAPSPSAAVDWVKVAQGLEGFRRAAVFDPSAPPSFRADGGLALLRVPVLPMAAKPSPFPFTGPEIYRRFQKYVTGS